MSELERYKWWTVTLTILVVVMSFMHLRSVNEWESVAIRANNTSYRCLGQMEGVSRTINAFRGSHHEP